MTLAVLLLVIGLFVLAINGLDAFSSEALHHGPGAVRGAEDADRAGPASGGAAHDRDGLPTRRRRRPRAPGQGRRPVGPGLTALHPAVRLVPLPEARVHGARLGRRHAGIDGSGSGRKVGGRGPWTYR